MIIKTNMTNIGDPQIVLHEGKYYCYATSFISKGFYAWVSDDLVNWSEPILVLDLENSWGYDCFWAPEVIYHNGKFVMHYSARQKSNDSLRIGVAVSTSPLGPFKDVHNGPMFDFGYAAIDGSVLICEEGNFFYYSRDCSENVIGEHHVSQVYCVRLDDTLTNVVGEPQLMTTPENDYELKSGEYIWNEGPCVIKLGDKYVMNYSTNCYATIDYAICLAVSSSPLGPWVKPTTNPVLSCRNDLFGAGHNAFFKDKDGNLLTSFHIQTFPDNPSGNRTTCIGNVRFEEVNGELKEIIE